MASRILLSICLIVMLGSGTCWAKKKKQPDPPPPDGVIVEVSPMSLTVDAGHDTQQTYNIARDTQITFDGTPAKADDLRAGMAVSVTLASDNETLLTLAAKDPPRVTKQPVKGGGGGWFFFKK